MNKKLEEDIYSILVKEVTELAEGLDGIYYCDDCFEKLSHRIANLKLSYEKDRIIEILKRHFKDCKLRNYSFTDVGFKQIINQIIGDDNNDKNSL